MAQIDIDIDFRKYTSHVQLVADLSPACYATNSDNVYFTINLNTYSLLYADLLLLIASMIQQLRESKIKVTGHFIDFRKNSEKVKYASRVNFFDLIGIPFPESFTRWSGSGSFTEIKKFNGKNASPEFYLNLHREIFTILRNVNASKETLEMLDFCLTEVMDNSLIHSTMSYGWASAQYFPLRKEIRIIVCDTGIGIHESLTRPGSSKFKDLDEEQAVLRCIESGVTSGAGMGNGLFFTSEFIKKNAGELLIYSGMHYLKCNSTATIVRKGYKWNGTFLFLKIRTDVPVDHREILGEASTRTDDFEWFFGENPEVEDKLW